MKWHRIVVLTVLCLFGFSLMATLAAPYKKKKRPKTDERVYLVHADELSYDQWGAVPGAQILKGKVHFKHAGMQLWCDSAYFFQVENSVEAFGHVRFRQGDTLSLTCDHADYNGAEQMMHARKNVVPSTHCTPEFLADLVVDHYMLMTPMYRQSIRNILDKLQISSNTNRNWLTQGAELLTPIVRLLKKKLLKVKSVLNIDETWTKVRIKFKGDKTKLGRYFKKYVWVLVDKAKQITYFFYDNDENDSRGKRPIQTFLGDFFGTIQSDGYVVYKELTKDNPANEHLMCWAHVRNKFEAVFKACKDADADTFVQLIATLYRVEAECLLNHYTPQQIKKRRLQKDVTKILSLIYKKANGMLTDFNRYHYSDMMRKALVYVTSNWEALVKYRNDGHYTIDNMLAERAVRPFTVKRKNSLFFSSEDGIESALKYHTLIETCKNVGLNVKEYFTYVFSRLIEGEKDYEKLLPSAVAR